MPFQFARKEKAPAVPLTDKEAAELRSDLIDGLATACELADTFITHTNREHVPAYVWQELEERERAQIADVLLAAGKRNAQTAGMVRAFTQNHAKLKLGMITGSRFLATLRHYQDHGGFYLGFIIPARTTKHRNTA